MRIGLIGAGNIGSTIARLAVDHGHEVVVSNSRGPETLAGLVEDLGERALAGTTAEAAGADVVVVAIPLRAYRNVPVAELAGKTVIDANNYYPERGGHFVELDDGSTTSSGLLAEHLPTSHVVKAFNTMYFEDLAQDGRPTGSDGRRAIPIAGDDAEAKRTVAGLIDEFGYDAVDAGPLAEGRRFEPGTPAYGRRFDAGGLEAALAGADRPS